MPRFATDARAGILEGFELKPLVGNADASTVCKETLTVRRNEVREWPSLPHVTMQPQSAIHRVDHSFATRPELAKWHVLGRSGIGRGMAILHRVLRLTRGIESRRVAATQLQAIEPSTVAGVTAVTDP